MGILNDFDSGIQILEKWIKTQPHLPQHVEKILLQRFIYACQGDLERTKKLIDLNYTMRTNYSQIFLNRDPCSDLAKNVLETTDMLILPDVTPNGNKLLFYRLVDCDPDKYNFNECVKMFYMFADLRFSTPDPNGITAGEVPIYDMAGFGLKHLSKTILSTLRMYMKFVQEAHPVRLREIHFLNCPSYLDKILLVIKPFIKNDVFKMMKFHLPGSDTLYKFVPKDMLPNEYGGKAGNIKDIKNIWIERLYEKRDYLMNEKYWKVQEGKRNMSKKLSNENSMMMTDNFRTLNID